MLGELASTQGIDALIRDILQQTQTIALLGASNKTARPSFQVMQFMQQQGYRVIPVNPVLAGEKISGELCYASLEAIPVSIDMVDVFRRSEFCLPIAYEAIALGAKVVWMQIGVENKEAYTALSSAGLQVVMNRCPKIEHQRLNIRHGITQTGKVKQFVI